MRYFVQIITALALAACAGGGGSKAASPASATAPQQQPPVFYTYRIVAEYPHSRQSYTQGLQYADGLLWEGTGLEGKSRLQTIDLASGKTSVVARLKNSEFGEGITILGDKIYQLTWQNRKAYVYNRADCKPFKEFTYSGEGWGLTTDGTRLYMSDGSAEIFTVDPETFHKQNSVTVKFNGRAVMYLNELEWIEGKIWANVYTTDKIVIINPADGRVEGVVDLEGLLPESEIDNSTDVLNGIAYDTVGKRIFVTGKNWSRLYQIELVKQ